MPASVFVSVPDLDVFDHRTVAAAHLSRGDRVLAFSFDSDDSDASIMHAAANRFFAGDPFVVYDTARRVMREDSHRYIASAVGTEIVLPNDARVLVAR